MSSQILTPTCRSGDCFSANPLILGEEFKSLVNGLVMKTELPKRFRPRLYEYSDYIIPKIFRDSTDMDMHHAANELNESAWDAYQQVHHMERPAFRDGRRRRRLVPHQTEIDKFYRHLSESEVKMIFGGILDYLVQKIMKEVCAWRNWVAIVDNTKKPFYGKRDPLKHMGSHNLPGTNVAWFFQGISIQSEQIHLFIDFHSLTKGIYRALHVDTSVAWAKWLGLDISEMLMDREFYRAGLVSDLANIGIPSLLPTKKYPWVRHHMSQYLLGKGDFVVGNIFAQTAKLYPYQQMAFVRMVIIGSDNATAWEIRERFRKGVLSYHEAMKELHGFFTNMRPWKNKKSWARYLVRTYKRRWNIETGIRTLNDVHKTCRERIFTAKLADLYIRGFIYDNWQAWRLIQIRNHIYARDYTLAEYKKVISGELEQIIMNGGRKKAILNKIKPIA